MNFEMLKRGPLILHVRLTVVCSSFRRSQEAHKNIPLNYIYATDKITDQSFAEKWNKQSKVIYNLA